MRLALGRMLAAVACATGVLVAHAATAAASAPADPSEVRAWLMRIHKAASSNNYRGTFVVSAGGAVSSARIAHYCVGADQYESIESLDGHARNVLRHNSLVYTVWPESRVALIEQRDLQARFPALLQSGADHIAEHYDVRAEGSQRVTGRTANVLSIRPKDDRRYAYRLWADQATGLLLRAEVLDARGAVLESSAFSDLAIGAKARPDSVLAPMGQLEGYRVLRRKLQPADFKAEGWQLSTSVAGFAQVGCVKRPMNAPGDDAPDAAAKVLQAIYSDGLATVSVFVEPYDAQRHGRSQQTSIGATQTLTRREGDWWVTLVGDVPAATLRDFASALTRTR